jgi:hypothetical protein
VRKYKSRQKNMSRTAWTAWSRGVCPQCDRGAKSVENHPDLSSHFKEYQRVKKSPQESPQKAIDRIKGYEIKNIHNNKKKLNEF